MAEPIEDTEYLGSGADLPNLAPDLGATTLPSARSYGSWAAQAREVLVESVALGEVVYMRARVCPFCASVIRCPTSDQSLVEHMKSGACRAKQQDLEAEIRGAGAEPEPLDARPDLPTSGNKSLSFYICGMNRDGDRVFVRSHTCSGVVSTPGGSSCNACIDAVRSRGFQQVIQRATTETPANGLNIKYYSHRQVVDLLDTKEEKLKRYRLKGIEVNRNAQRLLGRLSDHKHLVFALAQSDDVAVGRIVRVAIRQGCGVRAIVTRIGQAREGLYHCQHYLKKDIDVALLVLRIGGPRLLYALSKATNLPSLSTVYRHSERSYLQPSIAFPTMDEVLANILSICGPAFIAELGIRGFSILIDELTLEERLRYSIFLDAILGLCREHAGVCNVQNMTGRPISDFYHIKDLLDAGECHRAKEATLIALAPFGRTNYGPMVILVSGTCKTETVGVQQALIKLVSDAWAKSPHGESALGPVWSIATDGDARRRLAIHDLAMIRRLRPSSPIYPQLCNLPLLNLMCGDGDITHDGDFKHEEK
ncbi:hypothetical protein FRC09_000625, partial [Ceratobasidium sp. 395]